MTFGEHKGYGMAVACELLGGALTGGGTWHRPADTARTVLNGMLTMLIDPAKLGTQASFEQEALAFVDWLRQEPAGDGFDGVRDRGRTRARGARAARTRGHRLDDATWAEIVRPPGAKARRDGGLKEKLKQGTRQSRVRAGRGDRRRRSVLRTDSPGFA